MNGNSIVLKNSLFTRLKKDVIESEPLRDLNTGKVIEYHTGKIWYFEELTIDENYFHNLSIVLSDDEGQTIIKSLNYAGRLLLGPGMGVYTLNEFNYFHDMYGESFLMAIEGNISVGFTSELVLLALRPEYDVINSYTDIIGGIVYEQWDIGGGRYIYLEDGIVTSLQY